MERVPAILAVQAFIPEIRAGVWRESGDLRAPYYEEKLIAFKAAYLDGWIRSGLPVILDVAPGYDGRRVFPDAPHVYGYSDGWRNFQSLRKGEGIAGIVYNTWNGYTEGYAGMPQRKEDGSYDDRDARWMEALFRHDPGVCHHVHSVNGTPGPEVYGAICEKWKRLGDWRGMLGAPLASEQGVSCRTDGARFSTFKAGTIVWSASLGAHEVHGEIAQRWSALGGPCSRLGLPLSDESGPSLSQRSSVFEHGRIDWVPGVTTVTYY
jgi:hypothetical protein